MNVHPIQKWSHFKAFYIEGIQMHANQANINLVIQAIIQFEFTVLVNPSTKY